MGASSTEPFTSITSAARPVSSKNCCGDPRVLRRDPERAESARLRAQAVVAVGTREHHAAAAVAQVEELVEDAVGLLHAGRPCR